MSKDGSDTRERLIEAALHLIWANSYGAVSVDDICERAGAKKGSFYHFFPSKAELALSALEEYWQIMMPQLEEIFSPQKPPLKRLKDFCRNAYETQSKKMQIAGKVCGCPYSSLASEVGGKEEELRSQGEKKIEYFISLFENTLRDAASEKLISGTDIKSRASEMHTFCMGILFNARIQNSLDPIKKRT